MRALVWSVCYWRCEAVFAESLIQFNALYSINDRQQMSSLAIGPQPSVCKSTNAICSPNCSAQFTRHQAPVLQHILHTTKPIKSLTCYMSVVSFSSSLKLTDANARLYTPSGSTATWRHATPPMASDSAISNILNTRQNGKGPNGASFTIL